MEKAGQSRSVKKRDILLFLSIFLAGIAALLIQILVTSLKAPGDILKITVDGTVWGEYALDENTVISVETELGMNRLVIANGKVFMEEADCPDHDCIRQGEIGKNGDMIICLPHRLLAEIEQKDGGVDREPMPDAVVQ